MSQARASVSRLTRPARVLPVDVFDAAASLHAVREECQRLRARREALLLDARKATEAAAQVAEARVSRVRSRAAEEGRSRGLSSFVSLLREALVEVGRWKQHFEDGVVRSALQLASPLLDEETPPPKVARHEVSLRLVVFVPKVDEEPLLRELGRNLADEERRLLRVVGLAELDCEASFEIEFEAQAPEATDER